MSTQQKIFSLLKKTSGNGPLFAGYLIYGFARTKLTFFLFVFLVSCSVVTLLLELGIYYKQHKTLKGAFSFWQWFGFFISVLTLVVAMLAPSEVLYH